MIAKTLNSHSEINCGWEWTSHMSTLSRIKKVKAGLSGYFKDLPEPHASKMQEKSEISTIGFRLLFSSSPKWFMSPQFSLAHLGERLNGFIKFLNRQPNIKIIHIVRNDHLEWLASLFMARSSKMFINKEYPRDLTISVPIKEAVKRVRAKLEIEKRLRELRISNPYLEVRYEDAIADREVTYRQLFQFLEVDVPKLIPPAATKKQQQRPIYEVIVNFDDLRQRIAKLLISP